MVKHHPTEEHETPLSHLPVLGVPADIPPTNDELARRRALIAEIDLIRAAIGPIDVSVVDLIDQDYCDIDAPAL